MKRRAAFAAAIWMQIGAFGIVVMVEFGDEVRGFIRSQSQEVVVREPVESRPAAQSLDGDEPPTRQMRVVRMDREDLPGTVFVGKSEDGREIRFILADVTDQEMSP